MQRRKAEVKEKKRQKRRRHKEKAQVEKKKKQAKAVLLQSICRRWLAIRRCVHVRDDHCSQRRQNGAMCIQKKIRERQQWGVRRREAGAVRIQSAARRWRCRGLRVDLAGRRMGWHCRLRRTWTQFAAGVLLRRTLRR